VAVEGGEEVVKWPFDSDHMVAHIFRVLMVILRGVPLWWCLATGLALLSDARRAP
jgi:hypothetical protein